MLNMPEESARATKRTAMAAAFGMQISKITNRRAERTEMRARDIRRPITSFVIMISGITAKYKGMPKLSNVSYIFINRFSMSKGAYILTRLSKFFGAHLLRLLDVQYEKSSWQIPLEPA